jgi:translation initiation factor 2 subunit 2
LRRRARRCAGPDHIQRFLCAELSADASVNQKGELVIVGFFRANRIEPIIREYVKAYVRCSVCGRDDTLLTKPSSRRSPGFLLKCPCGVEQAIKPIQDGYKAQTAMRRTKG